MFRKLILASVVACSALSSLFAASPEREQYDVVIYGGTSAAVTAAVEVRRAGRSVIIVCPDKHLGGLSSGGLGWTDTGNKAVIGGLAREFYHRIWKHYQNPAAWKWQTQEQYGNRGQGTSAIDGAQRTMWIFEPHAAERVFEDFISEHQIPVHRDRWLDRVSGVEVVDRKIVSIRTLNGEVYLGKMFIDATYEGDLLAAAGVSYHVGREANDVYDETWNGIQVGTLHHKHWFATPISPYVIPGDASSGVLPHVSSAPPGIKGEGDSRLQAYCYRMCLTNHPDNRIPFVKPEGYDPREYELLRRVFASGWREQFSKFDPIPNKKTDTNNHGPFSTDNIGMNYDYPEASYERRQEILDEHRRYQQGLMYFMANDPGVPDEVRHSMAAWGLAADEFTDNQGWPHQIYVREARRLIGMYVMTEHDCLDAKQTPQSVGMGSYTLDSHNTQRYITEDGFVQNEGDIGVHVPRPYEISYGSLVPRRDECRNLLVPVCISSSHIAFGSIRMEPVFMILGHSAAAAACLALDEQLNVQDVPYEQLSQRLLAEGQVLEIGHAIQSLKDQLPGIVVDDEAAELQGTWLHSTANRPFVGLGYQHDGNAQSGQATARFSATIAAPGLYEVRVAFPANSNRTTRVHYEVHHADGVARIPVNQREPMQVDDMWVSLGKFRFETTGMVSLSNRDTDGHLVIDAVQWLPIESRKP